ncbi:SET domain-containing protein [Fulvivirga ulvae]|uniref:SET domain-containing protein n=1 Tax=Fulvivirga ulvae TaxID=2904245 RepID=UPI001F1CC375|nr:SET domain-containing protein [Fulvivirga ulvae]UII34880.1 SET domain-containing protein [Fulvivirga ulvae]
MIHPHTELKFISKEIGYGVVATSFIPAGTITWVLDRLDREFTPSEVSEMEEFYKNILDVYAYRNGEGNFILCWDNGRFVNHSFNSNCFTTPYDFEIAVRDIHPGEQLTDDYGYLNLSEPFRPFPEGTQRKIVYPDDLPRYAKVWDKKLIKPFRLIPKLEQPLRELISNELWNKINNIASGKEEMESLLTIYYTGEERLNGVQSAG